MKPVWTDSCGVGLRVSPSLQRWRITHNHTRSRTSRRYPADFDRADAIGAGVPCYVDTGSGITTADGAAEDVVVASAGDAAALGAALATASRVAIPPDADLWAYALTGARVEESVGGDSF